MKKFRVLIGVAILYVSLFVLFPAKGQESLFNTWYYIKEMLEIMPVILVLTALIEVWVPKPFIEQHLGESSGLKGNVMSIILGSISAGPIYAAFPISLSLIKKGTSIENIVIIISAWAVVKVPMLANEAKFLGFKFMSIRWACTVIAIVVMGRLAKRFVSKQEVLEHIKSQENERVVSKKIQINERTCVKCMLCVKAMPELFEYNGKVLITSLLDEIDTKLTDNDFVQSLNNVADRCPVKAIEMQLSLE
ncbi:permease [Fusibacter ferrireducens]|uniref:Permease n=1 Tax=Fusibacter ferrireducens TaxID=2785058 RepID=A0ABR9ZPN3_9FIRM|nr:permease [Fusibacter ferrireducens]MBF4692426.1 permease [Fusibacter ferrireducens]